MEKSRIQKGTRFQAGVIIIYFFNAQWLSPCPFRGNFWLDKAEPSHVEKLKRMCHVFSACFSIRFLACWPGLPWSEVPALVFHSEQKEVPGGPHSDEETECLVSRGNRDCDCIANVKCWLCTEYLLPGLCPVRVAVESHSPVAQLRALFLVESLSLIPHHPRNSELPVCFS